jgi:hypothetical protein
MEPKILSRIAGQGMIVEEIAHKLFKKGVEVQGNYEIAEKHTRELIADGTEVIYQATALTGQHLARADILKRTKDGWHLFEVKSSTQIKPEHIPDLCFQVLAFKEAGIELVSINLVLVNNKYIYNETAGLEVEKFLKIVDMTDKIRAQLPKFEPEIKKAFKVLTSATEPKVPALLKSFKYEMPEKFLEYYYKGIPEYSIYDIGRATAKELARLTKLGVQKIDDIPDDFFKSEKKTLQVQLTKEKTKFIDKENVRAELAKLQYPLYFLDYETVNPAVPLFNKGWPYQQIVFQYSLHIQDIPGAKMRHMDFLHTEMTDPTPNLLKALRGHIGDTGSVIVWNAGFETGRNKVMAKMCPEYAKFLKSVNSRIYDLMLIFKDKYLDYRFLGSASIKNVLPILAPDLSYGDLAIHQGSMATNAIMDLLEGRYKGGAAGKAQLIKDLKTYCERDTWAMVRILEVLRNIS